MFGIKNYKKILLNKLIIISVLNSVFLSSSLQAHEMWIEPVNYSVKLGEKILANEAVGQKFKGNKYAYIDSSFDYLNISVGDSTKAVKSRMGDLPTIQEITTEEGLHIITAETPYSTLTYDSAEKFANFLNEDGLEWVFAEHKKRGLPEKGFKEIYRRNPKTLVKVGHGKGNDKVFGMPLEWVVETNPYTTKGDIKARLLWQGKPAPNMHVNVFNKPSHKSTNAELIKTSLRTDVEGRVVIPRAKGGLFLINTVKMIETDKKTEKETQAVWESIWGSLSYEVLSNI